MTKDRAKLNQLKAPLGEGRIREVAGRRHLGHSGSCRRRWMPEVRNWATAMKKAGVRHARDAFTEKMERGIA